MKQDTTEGWSEPINEGLWRYDQLFGCPRETIYVQIGLFVLVILHAIEWVYVMGALQAAVSALTKAEPEWPAIVSDWLGEPSELDT